MNTPDSAPPLALPARDTRYSQVARALFDDICAGRYAVGDRLPTEAELQRRFDVGRHTVREAIRQLRNAGLVTARAGLGTTVTAATGTRRYVQSMNSVAELLQFTRATRLTLLDQGEIIADAALAREVTGPTGQAWFRMSLLRTAGGDPKPIGHITVYVRPEFRGIADEVEAHSIVFSRLEQRYGVHLFELEQELSAVRLPAPEARRLQAARGSPALRIVRRYFSADRRVVQMSVGIYPEGRFSYATRMHLSVPS
jgi:GntR family transcriptional regulator